MIAYCGLNCSECPAFLATRADDDTLRANCAKLWTNLYKHEIKPEQVNCTGCKSDGKHFFFCGICGIKKCAVGKGYATCAECADFACEKLADLMKMDPNVKKALEALRPA